MSANILIVVEGQKTEPLFFKRIAEVYHLGFDIYCLKTNIYTLYTKMKAYDFDADIKNILTELHPDEREKLSQKFAYTYLIFDCDAHHPKKHDNRKSIDILQDHFQKLEKMADYFIDETNPAIGKLYINYPMMESFRDCNFFFDDDYKSAEVEINDIPSYKQIVGRKKLCQLHVGKFGRERFDSLILQNLHKLSMIHSNRWMKPDYRSYRQMSDSKTLLSKEHELVQSRNVISVINTSLFLIVDYFGNQKGYYDDLQAFNEVK